jgi:hypothetical protein
MTEMRRKSDVGQCPTPRVPYAVITRVRNGLEFYHLNRNEQAMSRAIEAHSSNSGLD